MTDIISSRVDERDEQGPSPLNTAPYCLVMTKYNSVSVSTTVTKLALLTGTGGATVSPLASTTTYNKVSTSTESTTSLLEQASRRQQ